jgi:hypothetical protein
MGPFLLRRLRLGRTDGWRIFFLARSIKRSPHRRTTATSATPKPTGNSQPARCGARTRTGRDCRSPAVRCKARCRMHGGARGSGGPRGDRNGDFKHGLYTREEVAIRRGLRAQIQEIKALVQAANPRTRKRTTKSRLGAQSWRRLTRKLGWGWFGRFCE